MYMYMYVPSRVHLEEVCITHSSNSSVNISFWIQYQIQNEVLTTTNIILVP